MEQLKVTLKRWGNSFAIVLPRVIIDRESLEEGSEMIITVQRKKTMTVGELMDLGKRLKLNKKMKRNTDDVMREIDRELWGIKK